MKVALMTATTHNPFDEIHWASCLRENLTSSSYGEGLETGRAPAKAPRQSLTRLCTSLPWGRYAVPAPLLGSIAKPSSP